MSIPLHLLVLHDDSSEAGLFVQALTGAGFELDWKRVDTEPEFQAALGPLTDLVLATYALTKYDGLTALRTMRERGLDIPFIIVSGSIGEELASGAVREGAADYLRKDQLSPPGPCSLASAGTS